MDGYATKVVLIESINTNSLKTRLQGKLILNDKTIPFEISSNENNLQELFANIRNFEDCIYRLSLNYKWNPFEEKYISTITKINNEMKEILYVHCSEQYRKFLDFFQEIHCVKQLEDANNHFGIKFSIDNKENEIINVIENKPEYRDNAHLDLAKIKTPWLIASGIVLVCICMFTIFGYIFSNNTFLNNDSKFVKEEVLAETSYVVNEKAGEINEEIMPVSVNAPFTYYNIEDSVIYGLPDGKVALTFDDGPSQFTEEIVNILLKYEIGATFFFVGTRAKLYPNGAKYVRDHHMVVANHSWSHTNFLNLTEEERLKELNLANETLNLIENDSILFRPPYGLYDESMVNELNEKFKFVLWNRDPRDWRVHSKEQIIEYFYNSNPSGAIYILHENEYTISALPQIIEWIKQHDVEFVVLK